MLQLQPILLGSKGQGCSKKAWECDAKCDLDYDWLGLNITHRSSGLDVLLEPHDSDTMMHSALSIPEILDAIFAFTDPGADASAALVCKTWYVHVWLSDFP